ncbi:MAG: DNA recombination protein RmuC [Acidimicrobiia bacterium]|nr:DNA recombination protein RmuC [Acidimicrobiia bacterium]
MSWRRQPGQARWGSGDQLSRAELIDVARAAASDAARVAASEALGASQQSFMTLAQGEMKHLRDGLDDQLEVSHSKFAALTESVDKQLKQVDQQLQIFDRQRSESHGEMIGQIRGLHRSQEAIRLEAEQLRVALRKPSVRGRWGEMTLRRVVELAGMSPHTDFVEQHTTSHDGSGQRPDLIVNMAGAVTSSSTRSAPRRVSDAVEAADEAGRKQHERRHAQQMAKHVSQLAGKSYWASMDESPDFVVMFVPGDTF